VKSSDRLDRLLKIAHLLRCAANLNRSLSLDRLGTGLSSGQAKSLRHGEPVEPLRALHLNDFEQPAPSLAIFNASLNVTPGRSKAERL
jgi:hypothetical protein